MSGSKQKTLTATKVGNAIHLREEDGPSVLIVASSKGSVTVSGNEYTVCVNNRVSPPYQSRFDDNDTNEAKVKRHAKHVASLDKTLAKEVVKMLSDVGGPDYKVTAEHMAMLR